MCNLHQQKIDLPALRQIGDASVIGGCRSSKIEDFMPSDVTPVATNYAISSS